MVSADSVMIASVDITDTEIDLLKRGNAFLADDKLTDAEQCYLQAVAIHPGNAEAYLNLGFVMTRQQRGHDAVLYLKRAVQIDPQNADGFYLLATLSRESGNIDEAIHYFDQALRVNPGFQMLYGELGQLLFHCGKTERAKQVLLDAIARFPNAPEFPYLLGNFYKATDEDELAIRCFLSAVEIEPKYPDAQNALGSLFVKHRRFEDALKCYGRLVKIMPTVPEAFVSQGSLLLDLGRHQEALASFDQALRLNPDLVAALMARGGILMGLQRNSEALENCERLVQLMPHSAEAHVNKSAVLQSLKRYDEALVSCDKALQIRPGYFDALVNKGSALTGLKRHDEALASYDQALDIMPADIDARLSRNSALHQLKRYQDSLACWPEELSLKPEYADAFLNRGHALACVNRYDEALQIFAQLIAFDPSHVDAHYNESLCRLTMGEFKRGWELYEWRWQNKQFTTSIRYFAQPLWLGKQPLNGKTILLHDEQGLGDTIQFCRYAKLVAAQGATVLLQVPRALKSLLANLDGVSQILAEREALPRFDFQCPLLSLPLALGTQMATIEATVPYIGVDPVQVEKWRVELGNQAKTRIGLVWSGSTTHMNDYNRSIPLVDVMNVVSKSAQFICLQKEIRPTDLAAMHEREELADFSDNLVDFTDTAALIANLDLVISVDTSVAHLAGALGKPVWILLPFNPDWRWLLDRDDTPWYPSARLYRQSGEGNWKDVLDRVAVDLASFILDASVNKPSTQSPS